MHFTFRSIPSRVILLELLLSPFPSLFSVRSPLVARSFCCNAVRGAGRGSSVEVTMAPWMKFLIRLQSWRATCAVHKTTGLRMFPTLPGCHAKHVKAVEHKKESRERVQNALVGFPFQPRRHECLERRQEQNYEACACVHIKEVENTRKTDVTGLIENQEQDEIDGSPIRYVGDVHCVSV